MIYFTGDINLTDWIFNVGFGIGTKIAKGLDPFKFLERKDEDIWIGNFEGVASDVTVNSGIYAKSFRVDPSILKGLGHMDYYNVANNHSMEHGQDAFWRTVSSLQDYGSKVFGTVNQKTILFEYGRKVIAISGLCLRIEESKSIPMYWYNPEYSEIEAELKSLPDGAFKILFVHWGNEYINRPSIALRRFAHWLLDIGYDLIIGMHPHVLQGYEDYKDKRIYYSLGNFVFDMPSIQCKYGAIVGLDFHENKPIYREQYVKIDNDCCPHIISESEVPCEWQFQYLNQQLNIEDNSEQYHNYIRKGYLEYRNANRRQLLTSVFTHPMFFYQVFRDYIKRIFKR